MWRDFQCVQTIDFPGTIWDIKTNTIGDIVVASEDKNIYVFTRDEKRTASSNELEDFQKDVAESNNTAQVDASTFPSVNEMNKFIGKTDGEFKVFNDGGVAK